MDTFCGDYCIAAVDCMAIDENKKGGRVDGKLTSGIVRRKGLKGGEEPSTLRDHTSIRFQDKRDKFSMNVLTKPLV